MKIMATPYKTILWMALALFSVHLGTAQERVSKTVEKSFSLTNAGELRLENKYGNITLTGWDQDEVKVTTAIRVNHRKRSNAEDLLDRIRPKFTSGGNYVGVVSEIINKNTGWFADFFNRNNPIDFDRSHVQIDYEVFLPRKATLKVTNRFGDVVLQGWSGPLNTLIEHGDLWIGDNLARADIILKFGKLRARNIEYADLNLKNGELDMEDVQTLRLNSSGTDMKINTINSLEVYSNKDDISLAEVGKMYGTLQFSTLNLERLTKSADMKMKIADFNVARIAESVSNLSIEQESSEINLMVTDFSHRFTATVEQGVVRLPKSFENVNSEMLDKGRKLRKIDATYGDSMNGTIGINGVKGIITLRE